MQLRQLFPTREEAIADGVEKMRLRAEAQTAFNTEYDFLNADLQARMDAIEGSDETALAQAEEALAEHLEAMKVIGELGRIETTLKAVEQKPCPNYEEMTRLLGEAKAATTAQGVLSNIAELKGLMDESLAFTRSGKQPRLPSFAGEKSNGWQVKAGTYKDGDQRAATKFGVTCWNAWWSTTNQNATMEICQTLTDLDEGYYMLECKATTEHFCISDQHGYLKSGEAEVVTQTLSKDYFDLPVANVWDTLTTTPIYVEPSGSLTLGFVSSKQGAVAGKWHSFGNATATSDNREGWWCATGFVLFYHAIDDATGITSAEADSQAEGIYTLDGRMLQPDATLTRGIYIRKGKKILVR